MCEADLLTTPGLMEERSSTGLPLVGNSVMSGERFLECKGKGKQLAQ